jgi:hypothetical protein
MPCLAQPIAWAALLAAWCLSLDGEVNVTSRSGARHWQLPLGFERSESTTNQATAFEARGLGYSLSVHSTGMTIRLESLAAGGTKESPTMRSGTEPKIPAAGRTLGSAVVDLQLLGVDPRSPGILLDELPGTMSYFIGNDPARWRTHIARYAVVQFKNSYPGIDWICHGNERQFEYDFCLAPGAHPADIRFRVSGAQRIEVDAKNGDLVLHTAVGEWRQPRPRIYEEFDGRKRTLPGWYVLQDSNTVAFGLSEYATNHCLVIDPTLVYSALYGKSNELDNPWSIALDSGGNAYVTGTTGVTNETPHVFLFKVDPTGTNLVYGAVIGGSGGELPGQAVVDATGSAYVIGTTKSSDFPVKNPLQQRLGGPSDAFIAKLNPAGNGVIYSTYFGGGGSGFGPAGSGQEAGFGIAVDSAGSAYVTGSTTSFDLFGPASDGYGGLTNWLQPFLDGASDAFLAKLAPDGSHLIYGTYLGGSGHDVGLRVVLDSQTNACIVGLTTLDFPVQNAQQLLPGGGSSDAFVAKIDADATAFVFSTYLGGSGAELLSANSGLSAGADIAVDQSDNIYVVGDTSSSDFPTKNPLQANLEGPNDGFVAKYTPQGALVYATYLGGSGQDGAFGIAVDLTGDAYVTGVTQSTDFHTVNPLEGALNGTAAAFVSVLNPSGSSLLFSTYLGADGVSTANGIAVDPSGNAYVAGLTTSTNFPNTGQKTDQLRTLFVTRLALGLAAPPIWSTNIIQSFGFDANMAFVLSIQGQPNHAYSVDFSTDLKQWISVTQFNTPDGRFQYTDTRAFLFPRGFYRVK